MATQPHDDAEATTPVRNIEHRWAERYLRKTCTASSQTLATILGSALDSDVTCVVVINRGATEIHPNPTGTATTSNGGLAQNESFAFFGDKARIDQAQLISASGSVSVDILEYIKKPAV